MAAVGKSSTWLDRAIGWINPRVGARRLIYRDVWAGELKKRAYEGASRKDGWRPNRPGASANTDHAMDATELRRRSRALVQNVPYIAQALRALVANVVGTGIMPRWTGAQAAGMNALWRRCASKMDADGRLDINGLIALAYRTAVQDGEVLIRKRWRRAGDGLEVPLQFQVLEIDWLDSSRTEQRDGNAIINGIEYDTLGRVVAYWLFDQHPGDVTTVLAKRTSRTSHRVAAKEIIHYFAPERPGQGRGFPRLAPVVATVRDLQTYEDAEIQRKNLETRLSVLATGNAANLESMPPPDVNGPADSKNGELGGLAGGSIMHLGDGLALTVVEPKVAPGYVDYIRQRLHIVAVGFGVTYEMMTGDVSETNFSSARVRLLDFRREAEMEQWLHVIPGIVQPICVAFAEAAQLAGKSSAVRLNIEYSTPKWSYVDPSKDVKADTEEISAGLSSLSEKLRARGYNPPDVFQEIASDMQTLRDLGLLDVLPFYRSKTTTASGSSDADKESSERESPNSSNTT